MTIVIRSIPHDMQRYPTVGDWTISGGSIDIRVSILGNWKYESLIAVHELCEALMCMTYGITQDAVDEFDMEFEKNRKPGDDSEPGDNPKAPYYRQHVMATNIERIMATELGVHWQEYESSLTSLFRVAFQPQSVYPPPQKQTDRK
jgi:hypothetical protein